MAINGHFVTICAADLFCLGLPPSRFWPSLVFWWAAQSKTAWFSKLGRLCRISNNWCGDRPITDSHLAAPPPDVTAHNCPAPPVIAPPPTQCNPIFALLSIFQMLGGLMMETEHTGTTWVLVAGITMLVYCGCKVSGRNPFLKEVWWSHNFVINKKFMVVEKVSRKACCKGVTHSHPSHLMGAWPTTSQPGYQGSTKIFAFGNQAASGGEYPDFVCPPGFTMDHSVGICVGFCICISFYCVTLATLY